MSIEELQKENEILKEENHTLKYKNNVLLKKLTDIINYCKSISELLK